MPPLVFPNGLKQLPVNDDPEPFSAAGLNPEDYAGLGGSSIRTMVLLHPALGRLPRVADSAQLVS